MAIPNHVVENFKTICNAAFNSRLCIMECNDRKTGEIRYVLAAANDPNEDGVISFAPFGHLIDGNPYEEYIPPMTRADMAFCMHKSDEVLVETPIEEKNDVA